MAAASTNKSTPPLSRAAVAVLEAMVRLEWGASAALSFQDTTAPLQISLCLSFCPDTMAIIRFFQDATGVLPRALLL